ncbi:MAG: hypothetical protein OEL80_00810 [Desulfuromonadales bacterium]|jgi:hypothetical protein|nr:hypothetical protein [Desulfuromonadales bacterium]
MRYHADLGEDRVNYLIGQCLRSKAEAERMFDILIAKNLRKIALFVGSVDLTSEEHAEFVQRFSAEVEPTIWESSFRKH